MNRFRGTGMRIARAMLVGGILAAASHAPVVAAMPAIAQAQPAAPLPVQYYHPAPGYYAPPPPGYYAPPPAHYPPPQQSDRDLDRAYDPDRDGPLGYPTQRGGPARHGGAVPYGYTCYAGVYVCQLPAAGPVGSGCSCPGWGAPSYGTIR